jgi:hypothetical protein
MKPQSLAASAKFYAEEIGQVQEDGPCPFKLTDPMMMNILVAGFQHETNTFAPTVATYDSFVRGEDFPGLVRGEGLFDLLNVNLPDQRLHQHSCARGHAVTPVIWAGAGASAHVTSDAYERIAGEIVEAVRRPPSTRSTSTCTARWCAAPGRRRRRAACCASESGGRAGR